MENTPLDKSSVLKPLNMSHWLTQLPEVQSPAAVTVSKSGDYPHLKSISPYKGFLFESKI
jgi:hypothetical protein